MTDIDIDKTGKESTLSNIDHRYASGEDINERTKEKIIEAVINFDLQILLRSVLVTNFTNQSKKPEDQFSLFSGMVNNKW